MNPDPEKIKVRLLEREYQFACGEGERQSLLDAADYLGNTMRDIKSRNSTMTTEKIAIMAAMNISHELIKAHSKNHVYDVEILGKVKKLKETLEQALAEDL